MRHILGGMSFSQQLIDLRKSKGLTQVQAAKLAGVSHPQYHRYETGKSQPTLDVIRAIARTFSVSADELIFDTDERGPADDLRLQFEAVSRFDDKEKEIVRVLLESMIIRHDAAKWNRSIQDKERANSSS